MPEQKPSKSISWPKVISTVVIIAVIAGLVSGTLFWYFYVRQSSTSTTSTQETSTKYPAYVDKFTVSCSNPNFLKDFIVSSVSVDGIYIYESSNGLVTWKKEKSQPYVQYDGPTISFFFRKSRLDDVKSLVSKDLENKLMSEGFEKDELNTNVVTTYGDTESNFSGYRKGNLIYKIDFRYLGKYTFEKLTEDDAQGLGAIFPESDNRLYPASDDSLPNNEAFPVVGVSCADVNHQIDALYDELLAAPVLKEEFDQEKGKNGVGNVIYSVKNVHENNIIEGSIGSFDSMGGADIWVYKKEGEWKKLYFGQNYPPCSTLESVGIESGVGCLDPTTDAGSRKTR